MNWMQHGRPALFNAPTLEQLQAALNAVGIPPEAAAGSPLLQNHSNNILGQTDNPFVIAQIRGDGNCGFRAISYLLTGTQNYHWLLRRVATSELAYNNEWDGNNYIIYYQKTFIQFQVLLEQQKDNDM